MRCEPMKNFCKSKFVALAFWNDDNFGRQVHSRILIVSCLTQRRPYDINLLLECREPASPYYATRLKGEPCKPERVVFPLDVKYNCRSTR